VLGGFYVLRMLGSGAGGSVFVARRLEERNDPLAPELALKVPEYDGSAARALSEDEFMRLFRAEAGALLAVPPHENLSGFVTFDPGVRPKPILVMELVKGPTLERVLAKGDLDTGRALTVLAGVLRGLECMHAVGVGHLGVKPSNVVLREREPGMLVPVLVDYGLSGRYVRPGCATGPYGAPEIWRNGRGEHPEAAPADVYAFGCLAFELLTGQLLFDAPTEAQVVAEHLSHDGRPPRLVSLAQDPATLALAEWISGCLRREPRERSTVVQLLRELPAVRGVLMDRAWPLPVSVDTTL
jgi:eukaryotic-like serine/threonine-protein kinase